MKTKKWFGVYSVILGALVLSLLGLHTFGVGGTTVDNTSVFLVIVLCLIPFIKFIKKVKWGGFEAEIKSEEIEGIKKRAGKGLKTIKNLVYVQTLAQKPNVSKAEMLKNYLLSLVGQDAPLALAKLRVELENSLRQVSETFPEKHNLYQMKNLDLLIQDLSTQREIDSETISNIHEIAAVCDRVIHGAEIKTEDARALVEIGGDALVYLAGHGSGFSFKGPVIL